MPKFEWKVKAVSQSEDLASFASNLQDSLNEMEKDGFEVQRMELKDRGVLLTGKRPARRQVA